MKNVNLLNGTNLAYIGDAYFELCVRQHLLEKGITNSNELRKHATSYVSANAHYEIYEFLKDQLTEEEHKIFLRGRNNAPTNHRKNLDRGKYVISSGFEAIIGYLYLTENQKRLDEIMNLIWKWGDMKC